jgi:2',3'-cyclic-nucleotide 2'-phosphodiesterase (5'-nucleotidase family)
MEFRITWVVILCFVVTLGCVKYNDDCELLITDPLFVTDPNSITGWIGANIPISKKVVRLDDHPIGQLVAEALYHAFDEQVEESLRPDLAFQNSGSIRSEGVCSPRESLTKGAIKRKVLREVLAFNEKIYVVTVTYRQLKNILEHSVASLSPSAGGDPKGSFLQIYGVKFKVDCHGQREEIDSNGKRTQEGNRVSEIYLRQRDGTERIVGEFSDQETVRIATSEYLAEGHDGYNDLKEIDHQENRIMAKELSFEIIADYFNKKYSESAPLFAEAEDRAILVNCK